MKTEDHHRISAQRRWTIPIDLMPHACDYDAHAKRRPIGDQTAVNSKGFGVEERKFVERVDQHDEIRFRRESFALHRRAPVELRVHRCIEICGVNDRRVTLIALSRTHDMREIHNPRESSAFQVEAGQCHSAWRVEGAHGQRQSLKRDTLTGARRPRHSPHRVLGRELSRDNLIWPIDQHPDLYPQSRITRTTPPTLRWIKLIDRINPERVEERLRTQILIPVHRRMNRNCP